MPYTPLRLYLAVKRERVLICRDRWEKTLIFDIPIGKAIQRLFSWRWLDRPPELWQLYVRTIGVALVMSTSIYPVRLSRPVFKRSYWQCQAAEFKWKKIHSIYPAHELESLCFPLSDYECRMGKWLMSVRNFLAWLLPILGQMKKWLFWYWCHPYSGLYIHLLNEHWNNSEFS